MRGRYAEGVDKWPHVNQIMRDQNIGILALQETHLTEAEQHKLNKTFSRTLNVFSTLDANNPDSKGTAIVLNRRMVNTNEAKQVTLIPGRAMLLSLRWHNGQPLTIVSVYTPNDPTENAEFLELLELKLKDYRKPDFVLGDHNMVEEAIDRAPQRADSKTVRDAMIKFKPTYGLSDIWRETHPDVLEYTYFQKATGSRSRIDRILTPSNTKQNLFEWEFDVVSIPTDHMLVTVRYSNPDAPAVGLGRWSMAPHMLKNAPLMKEIQKLGKKLEEHLDACKYCRTDSNNPQTLFKEFKDNTINLVREASKRVLPALEQEITKLKKDLRGQKLHGRNASGKDPCTRKEKTHAYT
ncbi:Endonuclease/exonuclease/phosphatase [Mycena amicta]|nr:Endonuclease/exonuclease/phosphatase [Mycena amicta]